MRRLRIGILDLVTKSPNPSLYGRVMNANLASIMPQVLGVWCYPEDACKYYDYVLGFTDRRLVADVCRECAPHRPVGRIMTAAQQPQEMPSLEERWKFVAPTLAKAPTIKIVPMIGSLGCPYSCSFCIDSTVDYQPLSFSQLRDDLAFLLTKIKNPIVGWHDPNFGVRFDDYMEAVEAAVPEGRMRHIAESSLSLLSGKD